MHLADNFTIVVIARTFELLETNENLTLSDVGRWITAHGLELAPNQTEALMLIRKKIRHQSSLFIGNHAIVIKRQAWYLGLTYILHPLYVWQAHQHSHGKTVEAAAAPGRLMLNVGRPSTSKQALLSSLVVCSKLLYASLCG